MPTPYSEIFANASLACQEDALFSAKAFTAIPNSPVPQQVHPLAGLVRTYEKKVFDDASQLRAYATNRLIELTDHDDARIQIKAIELLGKIADVGLFADRTEITIKDKTTKDLEKELEAYFSKYVKDITPADPTPQELASAVVEDAVWNEGEEKNDA
jgi:hypothetical protein